MAHRLLLDTSSLFYRAFFALPATITDAADRPVNAVRGYLDMTAHLYREHAPDALWHCLDDDWRPAPRVAAYPSYKAERPPDPEGMAEQVTLLQEVLAAFGATRVWAQGWEADDAIGTLCARAGDDDRIDVVTGDRDLLQLVRDPVVRVLFTVRGVKELAVFDEAAVAAKYGVPPSRYVDFAVLRGDPSDGLPGISGVGEKTARDLVRAHASLDDLVAASGGLSPRLAEKLTAAKDYLAAMREVVPVRLDAELSFAEDARDDARLDALAAERALDGPVRRLREALDA
jgi:5'-3' exonuclease